MNAAIRAGRPVVLASRSQGNQMFDKRAWVAAASAVAVTAATVDVASAACTRLAFSVNDYGKEGPIRDAKNLLDKYIARWAAERKIKVTSVGPKEVTCELFIDLILFDEYTCKAAATVCWNGPMPAGHQAEAGAEGPVLNKAKSRPAPPKAQSKADGEKAASPVTTGSVRPAPAAAKAPAPAAPMAAAPAPAAPAPAPAAAPPAAN
jgi:hypothetical protein